jgi:hypothetical protein
MTELNICTLNVKGLRERNKRCELCLRLREKKLSVYFLQETHSIVNDVNYWNNN